MLDYFTLLTDVPDEELAQMREDISSRRRNPMEHKMRLAREITAQFHGWPAANAAEEEFERAFRKREHPLEAPEFPVDFAGAATTEVDLVEILAGSGLLGSRSEARRLIAQGGVEIDGTKASGPRASVRPGATVRVGKHRFLRIVDSSLRRPS